MGSQDNYVSLLKDRYQELDRDVKEEGNQWTIARQQNDIPRNIYSSKLKMLDIVVKQSYKKGKGSEIPAYQCIGILPFETKELLEKVILDPEAIKVDPVWGFISLQQFSSVVDIEIIEKVSDVEIPYDIYRQKHSAVLGGMISPRDFSICRSWTLDNDGTMRVVCFSVESDKIPEDPTFVRGHLYLTAWYATPVQSRPGYCKAHYVVHTSICLVCQDNTLDIKGSLPYWMVAKGIVGEMAETFPKIVKIFNK